MAAAHHSKVSLKLLIDTKAKKVLFAEAGKEFVDFLFNLLVLPVGSVVTLLSKGNMVGCVGKLYESVENLNPDYMQLNQHKDTLLKPKPPSFASDVNLLKLEHAPTATGTRKMYRCRSNHDYVADNPSAVCPACSYPFNGHANLLDREVKVVESAPAATGQAVGNKGGGYVKGVVTYMVMDNLEVKPMSTISSITLLTKFNVKDVGVLEEKTVIVGMAEALELLGASLKSTSVLTRVFLRGKDAGADL